jgi:hypothetical protein
LSQGRRIRLRYLLMTNQTKFCYHCGAHHPVEEMRQIETRAGKRWRCIRSIKATQKTAAARDAFGRQVSAMNTAEARSHARRMSELRQEK